MTFAISFATIKFQLLAQWWIITRISSHEETHLHISIVSASGKLEVDRPATTTEFELNLLSGFSLADTNGASTSKRGTISCALSDREARRQVTTSPLIIMPRATNYVTCFNIYTDGTYPAHVRSTGDESVLSSAFRNKHITCFVPRFSRTAGVRSTSGSTGGIRVVWMMPQAPLLRCLAKALVVYPRREHRILNVLR